jgi:hypothetical protein
MSVRHRKDPAGDTKSADPLHELEPGREVGWFFMNGKTVAIERHDRMAHDDELTE